MKIRCNNCMSVFDEQFLNINDIEQCPVCKKRGCLVDVPFEEFPQYYEDRPMEEQKKERGINIIENLFDKAAANDWTFTQTLEALDSLGHLLKDGRCIINTDDDIVIVPLAIDYEKEIIKIIY